MEFQIVRTGVIALGSKAAHVDAVKRPCKAPSRARDPRVGPKVIRIGLGLSGLPVRFCGIRCGFQLSADFSLDRFSG